MLETHRQLQMLVTKRDTLSRLWYRNLEYKESLKAQEVTLRIQRLQKARGLPDFNTAVTAAFKEQLPGVTPPASGEEQLAALRQREPLPDAQMSELLERRVAAVREALVKTEGIPAERLLSSTTQAPASDEAAEGRIEFQIEQ